MKGLRTGVLIALVAVLAGGGGAYAAGQITSAQIKDGTITAKDIKKGTLTTQTLAASTRKGMQGPAGPAGPAGPKGDSGPTVFGSAGTPGPKGDTGAPGAAGAKGDDGADGTSILAAVNETGGFLANGPGEDTGLVGLPCPEGEVILTGGYIHDVPPGASEIYGYFVDHVDQSAVAGARNKSTGPPPTGVENELIVFADCVPAPEGVQTSSYSERKASLERKGIRVLAGTTQAR